MYPEVCQIALPKPTSNHCPILLDSNCERWGPAPFCFELVAGGKEVFADGDGLVERDSSVRLGRSETDGEAKMLKIKLKDWIREKFGDVGKQKAIILEDIQLIDKKEDMGKISSEDSMRGLNLKEEFSER